MTRTWICLLILAFSMAACDVLEPQPEGFYTPDNFYTSAEGARAAVNAIYATLYDNDGARWPVNLLGLPTDNMYSPEYVPFDRKHALDEFTYGPENADIRRYWDATYRAINRANAAINNIPAIDMDPSLKERLLGEAKFLRGWQYFALVKNFGGIPLILSDNLDTLQVEVEKGSANEIYSQIVSDFQAAEEVLPESYPSSDAGRATSGAAASFLARVYLTLASTQKNNIFPNRSYDEDVQTYYRLAAEKAQQVINSGNYSLFVDYKDNFRLSTENGRGHVFSFQHSRVENPNLINFFSVPFECGLTPATAEGEFIPTLDIYRAYSEGDYRRDVNLIDECTTPEGEKLTYEDWAAPVPHIFKYYDIETDPLDLRGLNTPVVRYAEVLLIAAEAINEMSGPTPEAYGYLNMVRARARNGDGGPGTREEPADYPVGSLTQNEFRDAVFRERRLEFPFEAGIRKDDLDRSGRLIEAHCKPDAPFVFGCENVQDYHVLFPIPAREIQLNPLLEQNPGF